MPNYLPYTATLVNQNSINLLMKGYYSAIDIKPTSYSIEMLSPDLRETFVLSEVLSNLARLRLGQSESASGEHFNQNRRLKTNKAE